MSWWERDFGGPRGHVPGERQTRPADSAYVGRKGVGEGKERREEYKGGEDRSSGRSVCAVRQSKDRIAP